jgi:O-acetyl-ADP-ribose deacetylase (regulator of RNase III)
MKILIVDINPDVVEACREAFSEFPQIEFVHGSMLEQHTDVWVTPTNSKGNMSGGLDAAIRNHLGEHIQMAVRAEIANNFNGHLPVGRAICIDTKTRPPRYLVSTPTMEGESDDLRRTKNTALACAAAFQAIYQANDLFGEPIDSIAIPGLGAGTGKVEPAKCANLLLVGYKLFRRKRFASFEEMLSALNEELVAADMPQVAEAKGTEESHPNVNIGFSEDEDKLAMAGYMEMGENQLHALAKKAGIDTSLSREDIARELVSRIG